MTISVESHDIHKIIQVFPHDEQCLLKTLRIITSLSPDIMFSNDK